MLDTELELTLDGFRIGVTSDRRSKELIDALERRGATVMHAPVLRIAPVEQDEDLRKETEAVLNWRPDIVIATTAYGFRRWVECADVSGMEDEFARCLEQADIYVRGPKARGAVRAAGFDDCGSSPDERLITLVENLVGGGGGGGGGGRAEDTASAPTPPEGNSGGNRVSALAGKKIAVQLHGHEDVEALAMLRESGAQVMTLSPYRWVAPENSAENVERLINAILAGNIDAVTFTAAPLVDAFLLAAARLGKVDDLIAAFQTSVLAATVGPVTAQPWEDVGVAALIPERFRLGAMIRQLVVALNERGTIRLDTTAGACELRGNVVQMPGFRADLTSTQAQVLRRLLQAGGAVVTRAELVDLLPDAQGEHALDMTVSRLRRALPDQGIVKTVVKRGYKIDVPF